MRWPQPHRPFPDEIGGRVGYNSEVRRWTLFLWGATILSLSVSCEKQTEPPAEQAARAGANSLNLRPEVSFSGRIVFQSDLDGDNEIYLLTAERLAKLTDNTWDDRYPRWSPDGKRIAFSANPKGNFDIYTMDENGRHVTAVTDSPEDELDVAWAPDGNSLAFTRDTKNTSREEPSVWHVDLGSGRTQRAIPVFRRSHGLPDFSPLASGMAFTGKRMFGGWDVFFFDFRSQTVRELTKGGDACRPRFSADGRKIVYVSSAADGKGDIWMMNADGSGKERITRRDETYDYFPSWSPDGRQVVFCSNRRDKYADRGEWGLYLVDIGDGKTVRLLDSPGRDVFPDWR
jgi:Tol biopolymer transport system component